MTNVRSPISPPRDRSRAPRATALRQAGRVHRLPAATRWRPAGADPGTDSASAAVLRCPADVAGQGGQGRGGRRPAVAARQRVLRVRRRRLVLAAAVVALLVALALPWGGAGWHPLATPGSVSAGATLSPHSLYIVQPGDTLWTIAERLDPAGDPRTIVAQLQAQVGSDLVRPGERLRLP